MPAITRKQAEIARIAALLESEEYDTAERLAYAVLKEAAEIVTERQLWVVATEGQPFLWGPYWTPDQADKAWRTELGGITGRAGRVVRVYPYRFTDVDPMPTPNDTCAKCGHPRWRHTTEGKRLFCGRRQDKCPCRGFEEN